MNRVRSVLVAAVAWLAGAQAFAIDYALPDLAGDVHSFDRYRGKWVIVNYWATWCTTCRKELPELVAMHAANAGSDIAVVGVNFESIEPERLIAFVAAQGIGFPVLRSEPVPVTPVGKVPALPTTYIVDPDGTVVAGEVGLVTRHDLERYIAGRKAEAAND